jgi:hypothetical protein
MREIQLSQGKIAIVDDDDFEKFGSINWHFDGRYAARHAPTNTTGRSKVYLHRLICQAAEVDHKNGDKLDNRKSNLRACSSSQNKANRGGWGALNFKGVCFLGTEVHAYRTRKFQAYITFNKKRRSLGYYLTAEEAARAYDRAARELFGEYALVNFP